MTLEEIVRVGLEHKATDIHLEARTPMAMRIAGSLRRQSFSPKASQLADMVETLLTPEQAKTFETRGSVDLSANIGGVPCRINVLTSDRGPGLVIRLLSTSTSSLKSANLHPIIGDFLQRDSGLLILTGPTGSGKSTTLSALIEEINSNESRHIVTLESPIEYRISPKKSIVRQREVGRHTPSFEQGLMDALREDPDVLVVGEMREAETMRLTLNAAETGHLVMVTMHSSSAMEAAYRIMMSFAPERQSSVLAQLGDCLVGIVSHRMTYRAEQGLLVPCCEVLNATHAVRNMIRKGEMSKFPTLLQTGGPDGQFTFERYQAWLDQKTDWVYPSASVATPEIEDEAPRPRKRKLAAEDQAPVAQKTSAAATTSSAAADIARLEAAKAAAAADLGVPVRRRSGLDQRRQAAALQKNQANMPTPKPAESATEMAEAVMREMLAEEKAKAAALPSRKGAPSSSVSAATRVHKDGRIEIPEVELDLDELVKEFEKRGRARD